MVKALLNQILTIGRLYEKERSSRNDTFLHRYAQAKDTARYRFAARFVKGDRILNVACGEGYGSALLAPRGDVVVCGLDRSSEAVAAASKRFDAPNLRFHVGDAYRTPFDEGEFSSVVSIETIEHLTDHDRFLTEIRRVLSRDGVLILSSPDKIVEDRLFDNPHHINLLYKDDMVALLKKYFPVVDVYCQTPMIKKPLFMLYVSFVVSSVFASRRFVDDRPGLTGTNCVYVCHG
jgi:ubiquinone/menaquinone biosynthesis C-methylase UbiE